MNKVQLPNYVFEHVQVTPNTLLCNIGTIGNTSQVDDIKQSSLYVRLRYRLREQETYN